MSRVPIDLAPHAGFCIKTSNLQPALYSPAPSTPGSRSEPIAIPKALKIFVNVAWDKNVPAPPDSSEEDIQRAMLGEDTDDNNPSGWFVPVVVSEGRTDTDKAGKAALTFDCVFNPVVKSRTLRDQSFKMFIIELALQRIEVQTSLVLSREIGTPNIASKGRLTPRKVFIPSALLSGQQQPTEVGVAKDRKKPLIEEMGESEVVSKSKTVDATGNIKGILKKSSGSDKNTIGRADKGKEKEKEKPLEWTWRRRDDDRLEMIVSVPAFDQADIERTTLDVEARRVILQLPGFNILDINVGLSDAEIAATASTMGTARRTEDGAGEIIKSVLMLKRQRDFDVNGAEAEWRVGQGELVIVL